MATVQQALDTAQPNDLPAMMHKISFGTLLRGLLAPATDADPRTVTADVLVLDSPGLVMAVTATAGGVTGNFLPIAAGMVPATTQVAVAYDVEGVATLTFAAADAVTAAKVQKTASPTGLGTILAADAGVCY